MGSIRTIFLQTLWGEIDVLMSEPCVERDIVPSNELPRPGRLRPAAPLQST